MRIIGVVCCALRCLAGVQMSATLSSTSTAILAFEHALSYASNALEKLS